jgi:hypothetical protein
MLTAVLAIQVATFAVLGGLFLTQGDGGWGPLRLLLAGVQLVIYTGKMA